MYGADIQAACSLDERSKLTSSSIRLPNQSSPIVLIHSENLDCRDLQSSSRVNDVQNEAASGILKHFDEKLNRDLSIVCLCLYSAEARLLKAKKFSKCVTVLTGDAFQAQEADIIVIVTTRSIVFGAEKRNALDFIQNAKRVATVVSRAKHGLLLIGISIRYRRALLGDFLSERP